MTPEAVRAISTRSDGGFPFARWVCKLVPIAYDTKPTLAVWTYLNV
jgi:hypothetical protein